MVHFKNYEILAYENWKFPQQLLQLLGLNEKEMGESKHVLHS